MHGTRAPVDLYNTICPQSTNMTSVCGRIRTAFTESNQMCSNYVIMLAVENQQRPNTKIDLQNWCVNTVKCGFRLALVLESRISNSLFKILRKHSLMQSIAV